MKPGYTVRPKAVEDLDGQALYLSGEATPAIAQRFLLAAHETFTLLATQPNIGWPAGLRNPQLSGLRLFRLKGFERTLVLYHPTAEGVEILRVVHASRKLLSLLRREEFD